MSYTIQCVKYLSYNATQKCCNFKILLVVTHTKSISDNTNMYIGVYTKALVNSMSRCGTKLEWGTG